MAVIYEDESKITKYKLEPGLSYEEFWILETVHGSIRDRINTEK